MKMLHFLPALSVLVVTAVSVDAADDLFSSVRNGSAFAKDLADDAESKQQKRDTGSIPPSPRQPKSLDDLEALLRDTKATEVTANEEYLTGMFAHEGWEFPVLVILDSETQNVHLFLGLSVIEDESQMTTSQVFRLLQASQEIAPMQFTYSATRKRTELHSVTPLAGLTSDELQNRLRTLATTADEQQSLWTLPRKSPDSSKKVAVDTTATNNTPSAPTQTRNFVGRWTARVSETEAFALDLLNSGKFKLAHVSNGKTTVSEGSFNATDTTMLLNAENLRISGSVKVVSGDSFEFRPTGAARSVTFRRVAGT